MSEGGRFELSIKAFEDQAGEYMDDVVRKVGIDILTRVVKRSPVDTGRFRGAWEVTFTGAAFEIGSRVTVDKDGNSTIQRGVRLINLIKAGDSFAIVNPLPYARRLEYEGWSKQAPAGMVRVTLSEYQGILRKAKGG